MIVVDTNIIAAFYLTSDRSSQAESILRVDPDWVAPIPWRSEFRNVLAHYMRKEIFDLDASVEIMAAALMQMEGWEYQVHSRLVLELVSSSNCSAYDCEFVALARDLGVRFVTLEKQILDAFPGEAVSIETFLAEE